MTLKERTDTPQEFYPHVGSLESQDAIAKISQAMLDDSLSGLWEAVITEDEKLLLGKFKGQLSRYKEASREEWALLKEDCLLLLGSPIASTIDHLVSAMRTPAIAESAIRSAGHQLIAANEAAAKVRSQKFLRDILAQAIQAT